MVEFVNFQPFQYVYFVRTKWQWFRIRHKLISGIWTLHDFIVIRV